MHKIVTKQLRSKINSLLQGTPCNGCTTGSFCGLIHGLVDACHAVRQLLSSSAAAEHLLEILAKVRAELGCNVTPKL